jgi:DNA-binding transcriptional ArsR family regulator
MTAATEDVWYDAQAGPLVRLYAITGGRTEASASDFTLNTIVRWVPGSEPAGELTHEQKTIAQLTDRPVSVSEIAARLGLPLGTVRVILSDLRDAGLVAVPQPRNASEAPTMEQLQQLLSGLNAL